MAIQVKHTPVGGSQATITGSIDFPSLRIIFVATKEVSRLNFDVMKATGNTIPNVGDAIDIYEDQSSGNVHIFGGTITERNLSIDGGILGRYTYTVIDGSYKFDSRAVVKSYAGMDPGAIVLDIIANFTTGFTGTNVNLAGFNMPSISFSYQPPTKCLQKIANMIGWDWYIDANFDVHFFSSETRPAPFAITDTSGTLDWKTLELDASIQNMKNSVYVIGGNYRRTYTAITTPDTYTSVAGTLIYPLAYSYDPTTIQVTLGGVAQTIGIDQQDNPLSYNVLYNPGQGGVGAFLRWTTDPGAAHTIKAFGDAQIPVLGHAFNPSSITAYGEFQDSIVDRLITTVAEAQKRAQAEIAIYGDPEYSVSFRTSETGLTVGQNITINSTLMGISGSFTIKRITGKLRSPTAFDYTVEARATEDVSFIDIMTLLLEQELNANQVDPSTVLEVLIVVQEALTVGDSAAISTTTGPYVYGGTTAKWGFSTWGP